MMISQKDFYKTFLGRKKIALCNSITKSYRNGKLSKLKKQAVIEKWISTRN